LPSALDVAAWLGSAEARAALHENGDDAYERYAETLDHLASLRPLANGADRHRSAYATMLDAIETWLAPSVGDSAQPAAPTAAWRSRKAEVALAAWTELRHDVAPLSRVPVDKLTLPRLFGRAMLPAFVEPHPEAIAKLLAFVRQVSRILAAEGALQPSGPASIVLAEVGDLLSTALEVAVHEASDEAIPPTLADALATFPARLTALEGALAGTEAADAPLIVDVHTDAGSGRTLHEALGAIDEAWMVMREPATTRLWLAIGAAIPHHELVVAAGARLSDRAWRARIRAGGVEELGPGPLEHAYAVAAGGPVERD
jgi:hypothetical protein